MIVRKPDANGWYEIRRNPISKVGIFPYSGRSIGAPAEDANKIYRVYRPADELGHPDCIDSFRLMPITDEHTMLGDGPGLTAAERKGAHGTIGDDVIFEGDTLYGNIKIWSSSLDGKISAGKRELSCGYRCTYDFTPGTCEYGDYDVIQRKMRGNHLALVDKGRMGADVRVLDHFTFDLQEPTGMDPELKAILDKLTAGMDTALTAVAGIPAAIAVAIAPIQAAVDALDSDEDPMAGMSEDEKAEFLKEKAKKEAEAADATAEQIKKAVDSAFAAHAKTFAPPAKAADAMDAKTIGAEIARKTTLAERAAKHIGTFDHSAMDTLDVAKYALDKLGRKDVPDGSAIAVLDALLDVKPLPSVASTRKSSDVKSAVDSYLAPAE